MELLKEYLDWLNDIAGGNVMLSAAIFVTITGIVYKVQFIIVERLIPALVKQITTTMIADSYDRLYRPLMKLISTKEALSNIRVLSMSDDGHNGDVLYTIGDGKHLVKIGGRYMLASLSREQTGNTVIKSIRLQKLGRSHKFFKRLRDDIILRSAKDPTKTTVYEMDGDYKEELITLDALDFDDIVLEDHVKAEIFAKLDKFMNDPLFYRRHGIPHQIGLVFQGPPGTGKTKLASVIAGHMNRNIVLVDSPKELSKAQKRYDGEVLVMEEIDFIAGKRILNDDEKSDTDPVGNVITDALKENNISTLLTSLDGVVKVPGRVIVATTNNVDALDEALLRDGRFDVVIRIGYLTNDTLSKFVNKIFDFTIPEGWEINEGVAPSKVQGYILSGKGEEELLKTVGTYKRV